MSSSKINKFYIVYKARYDLFLHSLYRQQFVPRVHPSSKLVVVACLCTIVYSRGEVCSHQGPGHLFSGKDCSVGAQHHQRSLVFHCKTERKSPVRVSTGSSSPGVCLLPVACHVSSRRTHRLLFTSFVVINVFSG